MRPKQLAGAAIIAALVALAMTGCQTAERKGTMSGQWRLLFDGATTAGWQHIGPGGFGIENRALVTEGGMGLLWFSREKLSNCQVRVVFKPTGNRDNSGVFIRIPERPVSAWDAVNYGYEVQIDDTGDPWHRTGCLYSFTRARSLASANPGEWNTMLITLFGPRTRVHVNGVLVTDHVEEDRVPEKSKWYEGERGRRANAGYIGLQNHDTNTTVLFKEISVRALE